MILTVTLNPAYDVTYRVERLIPGEVHRVSSVEERHGGKGVNVSRVLTQLGIPTCVMGFADASFANTVGLPHDLVPALPHVRRTVVIHADTATSFWEPGPVAAAGSAHALLDRLTARLPSATGVVISGSLPGGIDSDLPARIARVAVDAGLPVVCDLDGDALRCAADVSGVVLMPNSDEFGRLGRSVEDLIAGGVRAVVATAGPEGMTVTTVEGAWSANVPEPLTGNATGAGDAAAAAVITGLAAGVSWPSLLVDAVATAAAAVVRPVAGEIDLDFRDRLLPTVVVR
ncbi:1-phosphofructokinase family hexose kinase [Antrihabitans cavernicola]|uniref:Carbohydrate kinase n=1 Tax=Antrihabitans cavernicola TaxID=2495913 RepID=A0A5A7SCS2_9NOCA|nr:PfkB family carbohydrate kinase [Spelaeibacter cavernicola]KAA0022393.1 carbohydrate kinase [Spelaeibacter cavernicola]